MNCIHKIVSDEAQKIVVRQILIYSNHWAQTMIGFHFIQQHFVRNKIIISRFIEYLI